jgi:cell division protein FtsN
MVQDFAKIRAASAAAEKPPVAAPADLTLLFTGLITGVALGVFASFLIYLSGVLPPLGQPSSSQIAMDADSLAQEQALAQQKLNQDLERAAARLQLEFYQELPNYEVIVSNVPLDGRRVQPATAAANPLADFNLTSDSSTAESESQVDNDRDLSAEAIARTIAELTGAAPAAAGAGNAAATSPADMVNTATTAGIANPGTGVSYMIQAGAFQQEAAATVQSTRLIGLGLDARVKKEALLGKTLFLVQAGPYQNRDQLNQAERILRSNNIDSMRITLGGL